MAPVPKGCWRCRLHSHSVSSRCHVVPGFTSSRSANPVAGSIGSARSRDSQKGRGSCSVTARMAFSRTSSTVNLTIGMAASAPVRPVPRRHALAPAGARARVRGLWLNVRKSGSVAWEHRFASAAPALRSSPDQPGDACPRCF